VVVVVVALLLLLLHLPKELQGALGVWKLWEELTEHAPPPHGCEMGSPAARLRLNSIKAPSVEFLANNTRVHTHTHTHTQTNKQVNTTILCCFLMELAKHSHKHNSLVLFSNGIG
jgi:hypothetical protein